MNDEWAIKELQEFIGASEKVRVTKVGKSGQYNRYETLESDDALLARVQVIEQIFDRVFLSWRSAEFYRNEKWVFYRNTAIRTLAELERREELRQNLGDHAPELSASDFHSWVWEGASSLWQSHHFAQAVDGAVKKLNAETQNKLGRRDVSEEDLFKQAFSLEAAQLGKARLRRMPPNDSKTYKNVQRGAMAFAEGIFAGIRNPLAHEAEHDLTEQQALEYLAALSVLARWVDDAIVETVEDT